MKITETKKIELAKKLENLKSEFGNSNVTNILLGISEPQDFFTIDVLYRLARQARMESLYLVGLNPRNNQPWEDANTFNLSIEEKSILKSAIRIFDYNVILPEF